jgi:hypothetical protein
MSCITNCQKCGHLVETDNNSPGPVFCERCITDYELREAAEEFLDGMGEPVIDPETGKRI